MYTHVRKKKKKKKKTDLQRLGTDKLEEMNRFLVIPC